MEMCKCVLYGSKETNMGYIILFTDDTWMKSKIVPEIKEEQKVKYFWGNTTRSNWLGSIVFILNAMDDSQGSTYLFQMLSWKFIILQPYVGWIKMKTYSATNFASPSQPIG